MNEIKKVLKRLGFYYLLMLISIPFGMEIIPNIFPFRSLSSVYFLILCVCLILYYSYRVSRQSGTKSMMTAISWMILFLMLIRGIKYHVFLGLDTHSRYSWYVYYIPILLIPLFLFYVSLLVSETEKLHIPKKWYWTPAVTVVLIVLVLTNDLHQMCFRFPSGLADWENYSYGWVFFTIYAWQFFLYLAAVIILTKKCRVASSKRNSWLTLIPFVIGTIIMLLINLGVMPEMNGKSLLQFPEALAFMVAGMLEVCMQLDLIPTNDKYGKLFQLSSVSAQITNRDGTPVFKSSTAFELTLEQLTAPDGSRIDEHTVLHRMEIPGGYGFWQNDVTELDELNSRLEEAKEQLSEEAELIRLQNKLREKQAKIEQRTLVYDNIAKQVQTQSQTISKLAVEAQNSSDSVLRDKNRKQIMLLGAYIKRYANLKLISTDSNTISAGEFALSVSEILRYLNMYGIPGDISSNAEGGIVATAAILAFEIFESLLEANLSELKGVTVMLSEQDSHIACKLIWENLTAPLSRSAENKLALADIQLQTEQESDAAYMVFLLPKGGDVL